MKTLKLDQVYRLVNPEIPKNRHSKIYSTEHLDNRGKITNRVFFKVEKSSFI